MGVGLNVQLLERLFSHRLWNQSIDAKYDYAVMNTFVADRRPYWGALMLMAVVRSLGALCTIDRPYWGFNWIHHHIGSTHVTHHLFSTIPSYHAVEGNMVIPAHECVGVNHLLMVTRVTS